MHTTECTTPQDWHQARVEGLPVNDKRQRAAEADSRAEPDATLTGDSGTLTRGIPVGVPPSGGCSPRASASLPQGAGQRPAFPFAEPPGRAT